MIAELFPPEDVPDTTHLATYYNMAVLKASKTDANADYVALARIIHEKHDRPHGVVLASLGMT